MATATRTALLNYRAFVDVRTTFGMTNEEMCDYRDRKQALADVFLVLVGVPVESVGTGRCRTWAYWKGMP